MVKRSHRVLVSRHVRESPKWLADDVVRSPASRSTEGRQQSRNFPLEPTRHVGAAETLNMVEHVLRPSVTEWIC